MATNEVNIKRLFRSWTPVLFLVLAMLACESDATVTRVVQGTTATSQPASMQKETKPADPISVTPVSTLEPTQTATPSPLGSATINADRCNLRAGPGTNYRITGSANRGDEFPVFGEDAGGEWLSLNSTNTLWVSASLVKIDEEIASIPVAEMHNEVAAQAPTDVKTLPQELATRTSSNGSKASTPVITNGQIEVFNISTFKSSDGKLVVYGEAGNKGDAPIKSAEVAISLYDSGNNLLDTESSYVYMPWEHNLWNTGILYPGEQAPFEIIFDNPGQWANYKAAVEFKNAQESEYSEHYFDVRISNDIGRSINDLLFNYQVSGEIENTGNTRSGPIWVIATLYDENGQVVGIGEVVTDVQRLGPGESEPFKVQVYARSKVESYRLLFRAYKHQD